MELRPYQNDTLEAIRLQLAGGLNRLLVKKPTGTGKTVTFAALPKALAGWLSQFGPQDRRMLVIAHREELLDQAAAKIQATNPGLMVMVEQGDRRASRYADVVVASIQTLSARKFTRLKNLLSGGPFRIVVIDEAHHAAAATYRTALVHLGFLPAADASESEDVEAATHDDVKAMARSLEGWDQIAPKDRVLVGVTATPNRSDAVGLSCVFQSIAYSYDLKQAIADDWLVPIVAWSVETKTSLDDVHIARGDFNQRELADAVNNEARNAQALAAWREYANGLPTLSFTVDVAHAEHMAERFNAAGIPSTCISGETPKDERRARLAAYTAGDLMVIFNCMVLTEGTDLPRTSCILNLKPTKSATLYEQMVGRGLRLFPGKGSCIVIDLMDVARRHSLQAAPMLYGLPTGMLVKGQDLKVQADEFEDLRAKYPGLDILKQLESSRMTLAQLGACAKTVNPWDIPPLGEFGIGRDLDWMKLADDKFRLAYPWAAGTETVTVQTDLVGKWEVVLTVRSMDVNAGGGITPVARQRTIATNCVSSEEAAIYAERFVRMERPSALKLVDNSAPWKSRPASQKQLDMLRYKRVPVPPHCTMGQASRLIDIANARSGR